MRYKDSVVSPDSNEITEIINLILTYALYLSP